MTDSIPSFGPTAIHDQDTATELLIALEHAAVETLLENADLIEDGGQATLIAEVIAAMERAANA